jgi:prolyl oligopeptidase
LSGELASGINLPLGYSISNIQGFRDAESFYFDLGSILYPYITYEYNYKKEKYAAVANILVNFDFKNIEYNYKEIEAKDSKKIPIIICKKKETVLSGSPTLLESYGGYGISYENEFSSPIVDFIERGGVYVRAYIRGGGELGEDWHKQGSGINKSNTFNDFISVAKFLVDSGYTNPNKLAIKGGSHGGLVVGVAYSLEPKLFKAAICNAAPLDILNLLLKTKSIFQNNEYGDFRNQNELDSLVKYNPYYNIKDSINYPSLFIYASENDERVPFINQAKFAALMQNRERQKNPILFFLEKNAGHYGAENTYEEAMDKHILESKFLYKELGME